MTRFVGAGGIKHSVSWSAAGFGGAFIEDIEVTWLRRSDVQLDVIFGFEYLVRIRESERSAIFLVVAILLHSERVAESPRGSGYRAEARSSRHGPSPTCP